MEKKKIRKIMYILSAVGAVIFCMKFFVSSLIGLIGIVIGLVSLVNTIINSDGAKKIVASILIHIAIWVTVYLINVGLILLLFMN